MVDDKIRVRTPKRIIRNNIISNKIAYNTYKCIDIYTY